MCRPVEGSGHREDKCFLGGLDNQRRRRCNWPDIPWEKKEREVRLTQFRGRPASKGITARSTKYVASSAKENDLQAMSDSFSCTVAENWSGGEGK